MAIKTAKPTPKLEEFQKQQDEMYRKSGKQYWEAVTKMYQDIQRMRLELMRDSQSIIPDWFRHFGVPIVFAGTYHTPHIFMTCAVKFHTIVWDKNYGRGAPQMGWKAVDRPPIMVDVRIPIHIAAEATEKGLVFKGQGVMASQTMPHSHAGGSECFVGVSGNTLIKSYKDYEVLRGRIANHLGGANLASLASHWGDWSDELKACFPPKLAKIIEVESRAGADPNVIYGVEKVKPDFTSNEIADFTWRADADNDGK